MQTFFSLRALADPDMAETEKILRACVHCGFCNATCPTYLLTGDELDGPRGRIYLIKEMFEKERPADARTARHIDRCLSCLSCMTTCPSGVHFMHLVDHARAHIETTYRRPFMERVMRIGLAFVLPRPALSRPLFRFAAALRPLARLLPRRLAAPFALAPSKLQPPSAVDSPQVFAAQGARKMRVALLSGCVQTVIDTSINEATIRLLTRHGVEVVVAKKAGCCGALPHHLGKVDDSLRYARANIDAWWREIENGGLDHIVVNASGCGTSVKDYGHMFRNDPTLADKAALMLSAFPKATSAAVPQALTTCCSRILRESCGRERSPTLRASRRMSSPRATSAASSRSGRARRSPSCTRSSCSIGRAAARLCHSRRSRRERSGIPSKAKTHGLTLDSRSDLRSAGNDTSCE